MDQDVSLLSVATGRAQWTTPGAAACLAFTSRGELLALEGRDGPQDGCLRVIEAKGTVRQTVDPQGETFCCLGSSPDGRTLAVGSESGRILLAEAKTGSAIAWLEGHVGAITCLVFSPDGKTLASGGADGDIRFWDAAAGSERTRIGTARRVLALAFSSDGNSLVCGSDDGAILVWHVE